MVNALPKPCKAYMCHCNWVTKLTKEILCYQTVNCLKGLQVQNYEGTLTSTALWQSGKQINKCTKSQKVTQKSVQLCD